jgi:hypothetical protein
VGQYNLGIASGDFNKDNITDLITVNVFDVHTLLGRGDGTFYTSASSKYNIGGNILGVNVGDFNNDQFPDVSIISNYASFGVNSGYAYVLLNRGDGTFTSNNYWSVGAYPYAVSSGDLDNDGKLDLISVNYLGGGVSVLQGNGDGTFVSPAKNYNTFSGKPMALNVADFNRDGWLDVVATTYLSNNGFYANTASVFLGIGNGTLGAATSYNVGTYPNGVAVGDFNGDNRTDIATCNTNVNSVSVLLLATVATTTTTTSSLTSTTVPTTTSSTTPTTLTPGTTTTTTTLLPQTTTRRNLTSNTTTVPLAITPASSESSSSSLALTVGAAVGGLVGVLILGFGGYILFHKHNRNYVKPQPSSSSLPPIDTNRV